MDFQIRAIIGENVKNQSAKKFEEIMEDAIDKGDEHLLTGLGVFLEAWWQNTDSDQHNEFTKISA